MEPEGINTLGAPAWNKARLHLFEFDGDRVAFDIQRGRPHLIQPIEHALLRMRSPIDEARAVRQLERQNGGHAEANGAAVSSAIERLAALGLLVPDGHAEPASRPQELPPAPVEPDFPEVSSLELNIAEDCNLRCAYCCVGQGGFGAETDRARQRGVMSWEVACQAIDLLLRASPGASEVHIRFFGGEPLLNWPVIEQSVLYAEAAAQAAGKTASFSLVTNGVLLDRRLIDFMKAHHFWLQISIDGTPEMHDAFRRTPDGRGSYALATQRVPDLLQVFGPHELQARATVTHADPDPVKAFDHLCQLGFHAPEVRPVTGSSGEYAMTVADYLAYNRGASELARRALNSPPGQAGRNLALFSPYLSLLMSGRPRRPPCAAGRNMIGVSADGRLFPCTDMVGKSATEFADGVGAKQRSSASPPALLDQLAGGEFDDLQLIQFGDLQTGLRRDRKEQFIQRVDVDHKVGCRSCWARYFCAGACASVELSSQGSLAHNAGLECIWIRHAIELTLWLYLRLLRDRPEVFYEVYAHESAMDLAPLSRVFTPASLAPRPEMEPGS